MSFDSFMKGVRLAEEQHAQQQKAEEFKLLQQQKKLELDAVKFQAALHQRELQGLTSGGPTGQATTETPVYQPPAEASAPTSIADILNNLPRRVAPLPMPITGIPQSVETGMPPAFPDIPSPYGTIPGTNKELAQQESMNSLLQNIKLDALKKQAEAAAAAPYAFHEFGAQGGIVGAGTPQQKVIPGTPVPEKPPQPTISFEDVTVDGKGPIKAMAVKRGDTVTWLDTAGKRIQGVVGTYERPREGATGGEPLVPTVDPETGLTVYTPRSKAAGAQVPTSSQNKPPTSAERKVLGFYERVSNAMDSIDNMESDVTKMTTADQLRLRYAPNIFQTSFGKRYTQAANDFINASLRRESGAAISDGEYQRFQQIYFPQPGDDAATLAQKKRARDVQMETFKTEAGKAYTEKYGGDTGGGWKVIGVK